jgi:hypothetical protein
MQLTANKIKLISEGGIKLTIFNQNKLLTAAITRRIEGPI